VGIQAKLDMIKLQEETFKQALKRPKDIFDFLLQLQLAQEIELAGVLARKKVALESLEQVQEFVRLSEESAQLARAIISKKQNLGYSWIERQEKIMTDMPAYYKPLEVLDNTVVIYPLK
jgi:hypothetical protein